MVERIDRKREFMLYLVQMKGMELLGVIIMLKVPLKTDPVSLANIEYLNEVYEQCINAFCAMSENGQDRLIEILKEAINNELESDNSNEEER